jgi:tRNA(fMet)-specific endonuclease VapC
MTVLLWARLLKGHADGARSRPGDWLTRVAITAGKIRATLAVRGTSIVPFDLLIAGRAVARGLILITNNLGEFNRVDTLHAEDWQAD